jgi:hypothetical protein
MRPLAASRVVSSISSIRRTAGSRGAMTSSRAAQHSPPLGDPAAPNGQPPEPEEDVVIALANDSPGGLRIGVVATLS